MAPTVIFWSPSRQRPRAGPAPPRAARAGDHRAMGEAALFPGSCSTTYRQKAFISREYLGMAEQYPAPAASCAAAPAARSAQGAAGLEALCVSLI